MGAIKQLRGLPLWRSLLCVLALSLNCCWCGSDGPPRPPRVSKAAPGPDSPPSSHP